MEFTKYSLQKKQHYVNGLSIASVDLTDFVYEQKPLGLVLRVPENNLIFIEKNGGFIKKNDRTLERTVELLRNLQTDAFVPMDSTYTRHQTKLLETLQEYGVVLRHNQVEHDHKKSSVSWFEKGKNFEKTDLIAMQTHNFPFRLYSTF